LETALDALEIALRGLGLRPRGKILGGALLTNDAAGGKSEGPAKLWTDGPSHYSEGGLKIAASTNRMRRTENGRPCVSTFERVKF
jgi:hypothetical protein